jgi:4-amino-4-deoxy-L-arabinose transferase-like glycosyltransferase
MEGPALETTPWPRAPLAWLPFLWSRVLFPGQGRAVLESWRWPALAALVIGPALLLYPSLAFPLIEPDESRYAQIPYEMLERGDFLVPRLEGEPYLDKPPLFYWLVAGCYRLLGVHDWAARLVPALAVHGTVLLVYLLGCRVLGELAAFRGAVGLALAPGLASMGRLLLLDSLLTLWTTLALFAAFEAVRGDRLRWSWWLIAALACGLGVLTKGPVALLLLAPPLWLHRRLSGRGVAPDWAALTAFLAVVAVIDLPWYGALCLRVPGFARYFFWEHHVLRFLTPFAHPRGVWFYGPVVLLGLSPATLWLVPFARFLLAGGEAGQRRPAELGFCLLAGGWCIFFFTLSTGKLPTYILPAFPFLALALGHFLAQERRWARGPVLAAASACALLALTHHLVLPWYAAYRSPMRRADAVRQFCGDPTLPVICYPRTCDSVAFYLGRADLRNFRSKEIDALRTFVRTRPRTVILCTHRHSLRGLKQFLPPEVRVVEEAHFGLASIPGVPRGWMDLFARLMGETALGLCDIAVVEAPPPYPRSLPPEPPRWRASPSHNEL